MRLRSFLAAVTLSAFAVHCDSEEPAPAPDDKVEESHAGTLVITEPARASFITDDKTTIDVRGTGATSELTINGVKPTVLPDGSFFTKVKPGAPGINLVVAVDGESRVETAYLYGHFAPADQPVANAMAIEVGPTGIGAPAPTASLTSVTNLALAKRDLVGAMKGKAFSGSVTGAKFTFTVTNGHTAEPKVALGAADNGIDIDATVASVEIDGRLSMSVLGLTYARDVRITVDSAHLAGQVQLSVDDQGALHAAMPDTNVDLDGFKFDTDNAGFPCCVDSIITGFMKPKIESTIHDAIRDQVPELVKLTLDGIGVPKELDLSMVKVPAKIPVTTKFDGAYFDKTGATITASVLFGGKPAAGSPAEKAPGWLRLGTPWTIGAADRAPALGASISIDAINQVMFAAWATGQLSFTTPQPFEAKITPGLPPVVVPSKDSPGALRVALGEVIVQRTDSPTPLCAVTVMQDVDGSGDGDSLVLTPRGEPTLSISFLTDGSTGSGTNLIATAAKDQLGKFLKPFRLPLPKFKLDALGASFAGQSLAIQSPSIALDTRTERLSVAGAATFLK